MHLKPLSIISSQLRRKLNLSLIHCFGSGGQSAPIRWTVRDLATWPTTVHLGHIEFTATSPYPRTVRASLADGPLAHLRCVSRAQSLGATSHPRLHPSARPSITWEPSPSSLSLSLIHSPHLLSQAPSHGGAPPSSPPLKPLHLAGAPPEDAGERRLRTAPPRSPLLPWGGASPTSFFLYFILFLKPKQGGRPRATPSLPRRLEALTSDPLDAGECFPSPIHPHCPRI